MLAITVRFRIKAGFEKLFLDRVLEQARASLKAEPACRQFDVCINSTQPGDIFLYELYLTDADFELHLQSAHLLAFDADTRPWVEERDVQRWERLDVLG